MRAENPRLPSWVPGGHPMNPLGTYALYLGNSMYRIHGTDAPWTIGTAVSKGCVRMYNQDAEDLYPRVKIGAKVTVTWQKFKSEDGKMNTAAAVAPVESHPVVAAESGSAIKTGSLKAHFEGHKYSNKASTASGEIGDDTQKHQKSRTPRAKAKAIKVPEVLAI